MSGDVQPRKRKDKKRKKDELSVEEHRGTAAVFGEGDVLMHSQHEHGTGGHWCAKIIFFSLLAVLVTLIGLIILENRGLSELDANTVETRFSGVLDGWIEEAPDDDHHDEHTLELKHHEQTDDDDEHGSENDHDLDNDDDEHEEETDHDEDDGDEEGHEDGDGGDDDDNDEDGDEDESKEVDEDDDNDDEDQQVDDDDHDEVDEVDEDQEADDDDDNEDNDEEDNEGSEEQDIKAEAEDYENDDDDDDKDDQEHDNDDDDDDDQENDDDDDDKDDQEHDNDDDDDDDQENDDDDDDKDDQEHDNDDDDDDDQENDDDNGQENDDDDNKVDSNEEDNGSNELKDDDDDDDDEDEIDNQSVEKDDDDDDDENSKEDNDEDDEEHEEEHEEEIEEEIEKIEKEVLDQEEPESVEVPLPETNIEKEEETSMEIVNPDEEEESDASEFLVVDDLDEPAVERIAPPPSGKPYDEIEDVVSTEVPPDTLAEEEEYEKQQEQLRQEEAQSSSHRQIFAQGHEHLGVWLKLAVGGALLAATHAVVRRATGPRDAPESEQEEHAIREETPLSDRRMTLISEEAAKAISLQSPQPNINEEVVQKTTSFVKAVPVQKQESEEIEEEVQVDEEVEEDPKIQQKDDQNKELYSDEDENDADEEVDEEEEIEEKVIPKSVQKVPAVKKEEESEPEDVAEDVEIIDDEQIEEEVDEEVEDEEEISDVDDTELLSRLEAKYGRLPEPERPGQKHKDGGNSVEDDWPGEPSEAFWREQLDKAEQDLRQGAFGACEERASAPQLAGSGRARYLRARALDMRAEAQRDNRVLAQAIAAYLQLLKMNEGISDEKLVEVALRTIDRIKFRGTYLNAEPVYRLLIRRFPNDVTYRNNLTISFLMANRADLASEVLKETLRLWPNDRVALAHYGFILKTEHNKLEEAVTYFQKALEGDAGAANEPRFYYHLGDALLMLGRKDEADAVHKRGAELGHFLSPMQRSLYNVPRLKSQPWWDVATSPYAKLARELEESWREILKEGEAAHALYEKEKEGLKERGEWSQLDVFVRGREVAGRCARAPVTCAVVRREPAARCRRGQVKFSSLSAGTHVRAHVGPTNCRLRLHLALSNTRDAYLRVGHETRQWQVGKVLMFDDSFEHEVWHNGTDTRLVLIVDVWHPALTAAERRDLPAI